MFVVAKKKIDAEDIKSWVVGGIVMVALSIGGFYLYKHLTQAEVTLINQTGAPLHDIQVVRHPRRYYLGDVHVNDTRVVNIPVRNDSGYVLTFVPEKKHRRYFKCPEYLYAGLHVRWIVAKDGTVYGETATIPGDWKGDPRLFDPAKGITDGQPKPASKQAKRTGGVQRAQAGVSGPKPISPLAIISVN